MSLKEKWFVRENTKPLQQKKKQSLYWFFGLYAISLLFFAALTYGLRWLIHAV